MTVQAHALDVLEFARLLDHVAGHASTSPGAARISGLRPVRVGGTHLDRAEALGALHAEHARVAAMRALIVGENPFRPEAIPELGNAFQRLRVDGAAWNGVELRGAWTLLRSSRLTQQSLRDEARHPAARAPLAALADRLIAMPALEAQLDRVLTEDGELKDDASPTLRRIRRDLRASEGEIVRLLERLMAKLEPHHRVDDASVTLRNGRWVIPVRREGRVVVGGIVHDSSQSGQTVFVEPPAAVEAGNRIRELEAEERQECERIFQELTALLRPEREALADAWDALVAIDALYGRARYALAAKCSDAELAPAREGWRIRDGRHPLLLAQGISVVPFELAMDPSERTLLVSGPNTGGKTVLLKALALIALMMQCGIPAPVGAESVIPVFDDVFADIGDEQSLEASLSTFSAHLKHLKEIVDHASADALVLIDELGSGTDPLEGAALGGAILEALTRRGTTTIATTHLGQLKELASEVPGVVNASLQFDAERLAPTYRLIKGIPGRSYGLAIARRLAMSDEVLARAEERVPRMERDLTALLADVEARAEALSRREREVAEQQADLQQRAGRIAEREATVKQKERELERESRKDARRYLLEARQEVERTIRELKAAGAASIDETALQARRAMEQRADREREALDALDAAERAAQDALLKAREAAEAAAGIAGEKPRDKRGVIIEPGDAVEVATLGGKTGKLIERRGDDAVVVVGALKLTVPFSALRRVSQRHLKDAAVPIAIIDVPEVMAKPEVDLRGMRVHEVDDAIVQAIDAAHRADLHALRIIHGKGTGALRERVNQLLKGDKRVKAYRLGAWNEGGAGVTVAELA
ncbi:Smr/MutS family protein [Pseudogemmatithrix spongiicola]|uniref:Endonuclease MutS2 n=1 Tax=Pseudogemmatithrix spongiicola TaxID=3062599 RepID=A0AA49JUX3_9BACT|nr:Smr/MutS family protein [Gemmatimonadaceae bacterium 'strain 138']WKW15333.1 Smr/MutS family protein [Gemmatimonadaceae bacterium 'strain 318']